MTHPIHRTKDMETDMLISGHVTNPKASELAGKIQPTSLKYAPLDSFNLKRFEEDLFLHLKSQVEEIRLLLSDDKRRTEQPIPQQTVWNTSVSQKVRHELLVLLESFCYKLQPNLGENLEAEEFKNRSIIDFRNFKNTIGAEIGVSRNLYGVPLKFNHLDMDRIWREVRETEFYDRVVETTELVMAVGAFGYPGCLVSVWVFVGSVSADIEPSQD
jgi:hypothetical protein